MRVTKVSIKNYRSFGPQGQEIIFPSAHCALVGKNNVGKSNICRVIGILLGSKSPAYLNFSEDDYNDPSKPIELELTLGDITVNDQSKIFALPNLTKQQQGALATHISKGTASITFLLRKNLSPVDDSDPGADTFEFKLWGFQVHRKIEEVRHALMGLMSVPSLRNTEKELSASNWTHYGQLMKDVLESFSGYSDIRTQLAILNEKIQKAFVTQKAELLKNARVVSFVEDIEFKLTKDGHPSELLRNLEIFVKEGGRLFNLDNVGTGTQGAILIGILELALKQKYGKYKVFCVEEPEAFIHPHGVRYLGSLLKGIAEDQNIQVIVSTHSSSLVANFQPHEIIRLEKDTMGTRVRQSPSLDPVHFKRFINQDNAELFFSDKIVLVEGPTEKVLFSNLDKITPRDAANLQGETCSFDKSNIGIISLDSKDAVLNHKIIADGFGIPCIAMLDKDFIPSSTCKKLCQKLGVTYQQTDIPQLITNLKSHGIILVSRGETEDIFPDSDIAAASGKSVADVITAKAQHPQKTSEAFKNIFATGKTEYAIKIADYYIANNNRSHPLADVIRCFEAGDITALSL